MNIQTLQKAKEINSKIEDYEFKLHKIERLLSEGKYWATFENNESGRKKISIQIPMNKHTTEMLEIEAMNLRAFIVNLKHEYSEL